MASDTLVNIHLGGELGTEFGPKWTLLLSNPSPAEAFRAIDANTRGRFTRHLKKQGESQFYRVCLGREDNELDRVELMRPSGRGNIYVLPVIKGNEKAGMKILAAVAIAVITYYTAGAGSAGAAGIFGNSAGAVATAGYSASASLFIGGVVQLLTPLPNFNQNNSADDGLRSNVFQGNASAIAQGAGVPLIYGRAMATPMPISVAFVAKDRALVNSFAPMGYTIHNENGVITYEPIPPDASENLP